MAMLSGHPKPNRLDKCIHECREGTAGTRRWRGGRSMPEIGLADRSFRFTSQNRAGQGRRARPQRV